MNCPNCGTKLTLSTDTLSKDTVNRDYYGYYCTPCKIYWHLHFTGKKVTLASSSVENINTIISSNLLKDLKIKVTDLEK